MSVPRLEDCVERMDVWMCCERTEANTVEMAVNQASTAKQRGGQHMWKGLMMWFQNERG